MIAREKNPYAIKSTYTMSVADVDMSKRTVMWVGNALNYLDSQLDVLQPGVADESIKLMGPEGTGNVKIKHALNHDLTQLPGKITELYQKDINIKGVNVKVLAGATLMADTTLGNDTLKNYLEGIYDQHSIGFQYQDYSFLDPNAHGNSVEGKAWREFADTVMNANEYEEIAKNMYDKRVLKVNKIKWFENSTVAFGANSLTPYLGNKAGNPETMSLMITNRIIKLEQTIRKGTQSDDMMNLIALQIAQLKSLMMDIFEDMDVKSFIRAKNNMPDNQRDKDKNENNLPSDVFTKDFITNITPSFKLKY